MTPDLRAQANGRHVRNISRWQQIFIPGAASSAVVSTIRDIAQSRGPAFDDVDATRTWLPDRPGCTGHIGVIGFLPTVVSLLGGPLIGMGCNERATDDVRARIAAFFDEYLRSPAP